LDEHVARLAAMEDVEMADHAASKIRVLMPDGSVAVMNLEVYLRGVVPTEMPWSWPLEALKAQAVAARTYAMGAIAHSRHADRGADICTDVHCQAYNASRINDRTDLAIELTRGQVVAYDGELARTFYSANCGGRTRSNKSVWGGDPLPYLLPVDCVHPGPKYGHGVGMCQWGAHDMAQQGADYVTILKHYYTGVEIENV
jgi:stage II sporulation protein D